MKITNEGQIAAVLAELNYSMPPEFDLADTLVALHRAEVEKQFSAAGLEPERLEAIAIGRAVGDTLKVRAGGDVTESFPPISEDSIRRQLSMAEAWGRWVGERAEVLDALTKGMQDALGDHSAEVAKMRLELIQVEDRMVKREAQRAMVQADLRRKLKRWGIIAATVLLLAIVLAPHAKAQQTYVRADIYRLGGVNLTGGNVVDGVNIAFRVNCVTGCVAGGSFADASAFTFGTTPGSITFFVVDDVAPNTVAENSAGAGRMSTNRIPYFNLRSAAGTEVATATAAPGAGDLGLVVRNIPTGTYTVSDGAGALNVICDSGCGGAATFADNAAFTFGTTAINVSGGVFDDVAPNAVAENSAAAPRISANRNLYTTLRDAAGNERGANVTAGNALVVDGSAVTQPVSGTVTVTDGAGALNVIVDSGTVTANAGTGNFENSTIDATGTAVPANATFVGGTDGTNTRALKTDAGGELQVDVLSSVINTFPDNEPFNVSQINGVTPLMGNGVTGTGSQRVTIASDNTAFSVNIGTFPDNEPVNVAQMNGVAVTMGNGIAGTGVQRVTIASDSTGQVAVASLPNEGQQTAANSISVTPDTDNDAIGATAAAVPGEAILIAGTDGTNVTVPYIDPCQREARTVYRVDIVTATTTEIAAATASEFYWICSINLVTAAANNVIIVEDDTATNCPSPTAGVSSGGTTAAEGWNFAANGGLVAGVGSNWMMKTTTANRSFCIITSAATQLSGTITYVSAP